MSGRRYGGSASADRLRATRTAKAVGRAQGARAVLAKERRAALRDEIKAVVAKGKESKDNQSAFSPGNSVSDSGIALGTPSVMGQGAGVWARVGDIVQPTKFTLTYQWGMSSTSDEYNNVRLIVVQMKVPAADFDLADFPAPFEHPSDEFRRKYRILYDEHDTLNAKPLGDNAGSYMTWRGPIKIADIYGKKLRKMRWHDTASAVAPNLYGAIKAVAVSDSAIASHPTISFRFREYAKDDM